MAPSAAPSIQQSYSAGTCRLDLTLQPSALSVWYPKPIAQQVAFKLWMAEDRSSEPTLLAEGDRITLQALSEHIEHRTRATLSIGSSARTVRSPRPELPDSVRLPEPLSYLQLCDISSVLAQYEQAATSLPTSLSLASEPSQPIASADPILQLSDPPARPQTPPAAQKRRGKLIPFPTGRRAAWASSAAAALFAVGLTTALWDRTSVPTSRSVAESEIAEPEIVGSNPDRLRLDRSVEDEQTAALPRNRGAASAPELNQSRTSSRPSTQGAAKPTTPQPTNRPDLSSGNSPSSANRSVPSTTQSASPSSPATLPERSAPQETVSEVSPSNRPNADSPAPPSNSQTNESTNELNEASEDNAIAAAPVPASQPAPDGASDRKVATADLEAEPIQRAVLEAPNDEADVPAADLPTLEPSRPQTAARASRDDYSQELSRAAVTPGAEALEEPAPSPEAIVQQEAETITQVTNYFLSRWEADEDISAPLSYQLQLSSFGEVVGFTALTEAGVAYRDRLLPDSNISFPPSNAAALSNGLILKVTAEPDGQISVEKQVEKQ